jgi:hypothetical protein
MELPHKRHRATFSGVHRYYFVRSRGRCLRPQSLSPRSIPPPSVNQYVVVMEVVDSVDDARPLSFDHHQQINSALEDVLEQIGQGGLVQTLAIDPGNLHSVVLPRCVLRSDNDIVLATGMTVPDIATLIDLRPAGKLTDEWPTDRVITDHNTISTLIERAVKNGHELSAEPILDYLATEAELLDIDTMREELTDIYRLDYTIGPDAQPPRTTPEAIRSILALRLRMSDIKNRVAITGSHRNLYEKSLVENIAELDSLALVSVNNLLYELQIRLNKADEVRQADSDRQESRDRRIAQLVAALVLPALWFSFLATNVVPEKVHGLVLRSAIPLTAALVISVALALAGWFLVDYMRTGKNSDA